MKKLVGIAVFLLVLYIALLSASPGARSLDNHFNLARRIGLFGIISLGAGLLIISGGIDLSIGSVIGLCSTFCATLLLWTSTDADGNQIHLVPPALAIGGAILLGSVIGLVNGLCVTKLRVQPFIVTLCGLFIYRGIARWMTGDQEKNLGKDFVAWKSALYSSEAFVLPMSLVILLALLIVAAIFLHLSVYGRYLYAIGSNERAARYSGIATDRYKVLAYVLCSTTAALFAVMYLMQENAIQPSSTGNFYELYAIAGAVLGGCSLRGGEGSVLGMLIGTAILIILPNLINMWGFRTELEFTIIGVALLIGAILDEWLRVVETWLRRHGKKG